MTTKKARSRRLVRSVDVLYQYTLSAVCGIKRVNVYAAHHEGDRGNEYSEWRADLWADRFVCRIRARTRIALHDAILRAGWPSPWHEVGTTLTAQFVADMQAAGWTTKLDTVFRDNQCAGTAEIMVDEIRVTASVFRDMILIRCRAPGIGPIGYRTAYTMAEWANLGAAFFTAETVRDFRERRLDSRGVFVWRWESGAMSQAGIQPVSTTPSELIAQSDMPDGTVVNRNGARAVAGEIPFGVAPVALRKGEAFMPNRNNVEEP